MPERCFCPATSLLALVLLFSNALLSQHQLSLNLHVVIPSHFTLLSVRETRNLKRGY